MAWIIEHETETGDTGAPLVWSNSEGFTDSDNYETFSDNERKTLNLPIGGIWVSVAWNKN
jgi:hypothetical protein